MCVAIRMCLESPETLVDGLSQDRVLDRSLCLMVTSPHSLYPHPVIGGQLSHNPANRRPRIWEQDCPRHHLYSV